MTATATATVTVYTTQTCPWCDRVKDYLSRHGVPFKEVDVSSDYEAAMEMIKKSGQQGVPVVMADDDVIVGFDQARLAKIVERHGRPKRAPLGLLAANAEEYFEKHPEIKERYPEGTKGVFVGKVRPDSVAERAGIEHGDVITSVAGKRVRNMSTLDQLIDTLQAGQAVSIRYLRGTEERTGSFQF